MTQPHIPRFRAKKFSLKRGGEVTYYFWDGRSKGLGTIGLGKSLERAMVLWNRCEQGHPPQRNPSGKPKAERRKFSWGPWKTAPKWARQLFLAAENRCVATGRPFTIAPSDFLEVVARCGGRCEVSGIPFSLTDQVRDPFAPSLDRIDCSRGYELGNVRLVCMIANVAMNDWGEGPLRLLANALCANAAPIDAPIAPVSIAHDRLQQSHAEELANSPGGSTHPGAV